MPSIRARGFVLVVIPGDHEPRHVHVMHGSRHGPELVAVLGDDGTVVLREADRTLSRADVRRGLALVEENFDELAEIWKEYNGEETPSGQRS